MIILQLVQEMLPDFRERAVVAQDALDIFIEHRTMMAEQHQRPGEHINPRKGYPPELMRRL